MKSCRGLFRLATVAAAAAAAANFSVEAAEAGGGKKDPSAAAPQQQLESQSPKATLFESAKAVLECHVCKVRRTNDAGNFRSRCYERT